MAGWSWLLQEILRSFHSQRCFFPMKIPRLNQKEKQKPLVFQRSPGLQGPHVGTSWMDVRWWNQITTTFAVPLYWLVHRGPYSGLLYSLYNWAGFHPLYTANNQGPLVDNSLVRSRDFCVNRGPDRKRFMISFRSCGSILASDEDESGVIDAKVWLWWIPSLYKRWLIPTRMEPWKWK